MRGVGVKYSVEDPFEIRDVLFGILSIEGLPMKDIDEDFIIAGVSGLGTRYSVDDEAFEVLDSLANAGKLGFSMLKCFGLFNNLFPMSSLYLSSNKL